MNSGRHALIGEDDLRPQFEQQVALVRGLDPGPARALSRELLRVIEEHTRIFVEKGFDERHRRVYGFLHLTFAEYLTARHFAEQWSSGDLDLRDKVHNPRWHEVILLMAGRVGGWATAQGSRLVTELLGLGSPHERVLHRDLLMTAEVLADNVRVSRDAFDDVVRPLVDLALHSPFHELRSVALRRLSSIARVAALPQLTHWVSSSALDVESRAAWVLAVTGDRSPGTMARVVSSMMVDDVRDLSMLTMAGFSFQQKQGAALMINGPRLWLNVYPDSDVAEALAKSGMPQVTAKSLPRRRAKTGSHVLLDLSNASKADVPAIVDALMSGRLGSIYSALPSGFPRQVLPLVLKGLLRGAVGAKPAEADRALECCEWLLEDYTGGTARPTVSRELQPLVRDVLIDGSPTTARVRAAQILAAALPARLPDQALAMSIRESPIAVAAASAEWSLRFATRPSLASVRETMNWLRQSEPSSQTARVYRVLLRSRWHRDAEEILVGGFEADRRLPTELWENERWITDLTELATWPASAELESRIGRQVERWIRAKTTANIPRRLSIDLPTRSALTGKKALRTIPVSYMRDSRPHARRRAVLLWSIWRSEDDSCEPALRMLEDTDSAVRAAAIGSLRRSDGNSEVIERLIELMKTGSKSDRTASARALGSLVADPQRTMVLDEIVRLHNSAPTDNALFTAAWTIADTSSELAHSA